MNENIDLTKILKDCPEGWKFYSSVYGEVEFLEVLHDSPVPLHERDDELRLQLINKHKYPIKLMADIGEYYVSRGGRHRYSVGECTLFPSLEQRDWSKFTAPWYKKEKFDPTTLNVFDKVLVKISNESYNIWFADFVAEPAHVKNETPLILGAKEANMVIPYNDDTKHLVGTTGKAPEYYRYWED